MFQSYPVDIFYDENGTVIVKFEDVPEAISVGANLDAALAWAQDALIVALSGYIDEQRDIPIPDVSLDNNKETICLPPQVVMKLSIYQSMRNRGMTIPDIAKCMDVEVETISWLLSLDHDTGLSMLGQALECVGKMLVIDIKEAA